MRGELLTDGVFEDKDVLRGGWVRFATTAQRLNVTLQTVYNWHGRGVGVGRNKKRRVFHLRGVYFGGEARTKVAWLEQFLSDSDEYRKQIRVTEKRRGSSRSRT